MHSIQRYLLHGLLLTAILPTHPARGAFTDVTASTGIHHVQWSPAPQRTYPEAWYMSGGAAAGDFDGDGWVDLYVTRLDASDVLYRNNQDGTFSDVSQEAGFSQSLATNGAAWGDVDNDGDADLYVTALETDQFYLYINDGRGRFQEQAIARGANVPASHSRQGYSVTWGDFDRDGYLDLHTTEWGSLPNAQGVTTTTARLLRNRGAAAPGHFVDVTDSAGVSLTGVTGHGQQGPMSGVFSFASRFVDMDRDGWSDLVVAGDFRTSRLFWNNGDGTFTDGTVAAGVGTDENGMGSAVGDYDNDGDLDWFVTSIYDADGTCDPLMGGQPCNWGSTGNRLYRNEGQRLFSDVTDAEQVRDGGWGWGSTFLDYDLDGDLDLTMTNGVQFPFTSLDDAFHDDPLRLWRNDQSTAGFEEVAAAEGLTDHGSGKGLITLDYDRDGDLDLFVTNNAGQPVLYRNDLDGELSWLSIDVVGTISNRDGIGTQITLDPDDAVVGDEQYREIDAGSNFLGQNEGIAHFGVAESAMIDTLRVRWPSGQIQEWHDVVTNEQLRLVEPVPEPDTMLLCYAMIVICGRNLRFATRTRHNA